MGQLYISQLRKETLLTLLYINVINRQKQQLHENISIKCCNLHDDNVNTKQQDDQIGAQKNNTAR